MLELFQVHFAQLFSSSSLCSAFFGMLCARRFVCCCCTRFSQQPISPGAPSLISHCGSKKAKTKAKNQYLQFKVRKSVLSSVLLTIDSSIFGKRYLKKRVINLSYRLLLDNVNMTDGKELISYPVMRVDGMGSSQVNTPCSLNRALL